MVHPPIFFLTNHQLHKNKIKHKVLSRKPPVLVVHASCVLKNNKALWRYLGVENDAAEDSEVGSHKLIITFTGSVDRCCRLAFSGCENLL